MSTTPIVIQRCDIVDKIAEHKCNCACSHPIATSEHHPAIHPESDLRLHPELHEAFLDATHRVVFVPSGENSIVVLNDTAWDILSAFKAPNHWRTQFPFWCEQWGEPIVNDILSRFVGLEFLRDPKEQVLPVIEQSHVLEAWLHVTDRCNLRCHYCFLPHDCVDMPLETGSAAIDATFRSALAHMYPKVKLKYAGGEAMLRFPFIVELHRYARGLSEQHGIILDGIVLSNGTCLTEEIMEMMQAQQLRLMISLDGLGEFHDRQRSYVNGHGSSIDVTRAVDMALECGLTPDISITVSGRNAEGLPDLIEWVLKRDLLFNINFYRENDSSTAYEDLRLDEEWIVAGVRAAFRVIETNLPRCCLLPSLVDLADLSFPHLRACSAGQSYLVFDCSGQVSKCQMQMEKPIATVEADDPLALIRADMLGIRNLSVEEKEVCCSCEWRYWCAGGCSFATHRTTGRYDTESPNCSIYRTLYPEAIRLEGLRLLKWQGPDPQEHQ